MKIIKGNIMDITEGIIIHQVNCQNVIGAGLAKQIITKYPIVEKVYHTICETYPKQQLLGKCSFIHVTDKLTIVNLYGQYYYGNPKKTGKVYTDVNTLTNCLRDIYEKYKDNNSTKNDQKITHTKTPIYIPYGIGCGLGGANWEDIETRIKDLDITVVKL